MMNLRKLPLLTKRSCLRRRARGFSLVTGIFLLVILSALGAFMVIFTGLQQKTVQNDVVGVRAYYAARAGLDWALFRALDPENSIAPGAAAFATCAQASGTIAAGSLGGSLAAFTVVIGCTDTPASEGNRAIHIYEITATACNQAVCPEPGTPISGYVERKVVVTVAKCKDPTAAGPRFACGA